MMKIASALCAILAVGGLAAGQEPTMKQQVDEELARGQFYSGEKAERLVNLGTEAVPYLAERLYSYDFPLVILMVFAEMADDRATDPLIQFIYSRRDQWSTSDVLCKFAIRALKEIGDSRGESLLYTLSTEEGIHFRIQFEATAALARLGSPQTKQSAWSRILEIYHTEEMNPNRAMENLTPGEVYVGLCEVQSEEGKAIVSSVLRGGAESYVKSELLAVLARRETTKESRMLLDSIRSIVTSSAENDEYPAKLAALKALVLYDQELSKDDLDLLYQGVEAQIANKSHPHTARELARVKAAIDRRN